MNEPSEELVLAFTPDGAGAYRGQVLASPLGAGEPFSWQPDWSELSPMSDRLAEWVEADSSAEPVPGAKSPAETLAQKLTQVLFSSAAGRKLTPSLHRLSVPGSLGRRRALRLRLILPRASATGPDPVAALPWELLQAPADGGFLGLWEQVSLVRSYDAPAEGTARGPLPVDLPLRVLLIPASPVDCKPLDIERERREIQGVSRLEVLELEIFRGGALEDLRDLLKQRDFHVVHFMGHSGVSRRTGERGFLFENPLRNHEGVTGSDLVRELAGLPSLRLVILNSCRSAGVAEALLAVGIEAVIAMQLPIGDRAALDFSSQLYEDLTAGFSIEDAVGAFRRAAAHYSREWFNPAVFLRGAQSRLFDPGQLGARFSATEGRFRLGLRSFTDDKDNGHPPAFAKDMERESHRFLSLASCFYGRKMEQPKLWEHRVLPTIQRFLASLVGESRPLLLDMAAHQTIAFTAGYYLSTNDGGDIVVRQRGIRGTEDWNVREGEVPAGPLWDFSEKRLESPEKNREDIALVVVIARAGVVGDVERYLAEGKIAAGRLLVARVPEPGLTSVKSGRHALRLAEELAEWVWRSSAGNRRRVVHLFVASPNGFLFLLGRVARNLGRIQLYEYMMGEPGGDVYVPSLELPPKRFEPAPA